jgi:hypothetical protein
VPPATPASLASETARVLFAPDVMPRMRLSADVQEGQAAPPLT